MCTRKRLFHVIWCIQRLPTSKNSPRNVCPGECSGCQSKPGRNDKHVCLLREETPIPKGLSPAVSLHKTRATFYFFFKKTALQQAEERVVDLTSATM